MQASTRTRNKPMRQGGVRQRWAEYQTFGTGKGWGVPHQAPNPPH
jgi:hypothetical protein